MGGLFRNLFACALCVIALTLSAGVTGLAAETLQTPTTKVPGPLAVEQVA